MRDRADAAALIRNVGSTCAHSEGCLVHVFEVRGREVYCDEARFAHICIPVEPDSGRLVLMMKQHCGGSMAPLRRPASFYATLSVGIF
jgi:hypothetical protein